MGQPNFEAESAVWCAIAWVVLIARLISRRMRLGAWRSLVLEDALAILALLFATAMAVLLNEYIREFVVWLLVKDRDQSHHMAAKLLKLIVAADQMQILSIWTTKAGMLLLYYRLTSLTDKRKIVVGTAIYVACTFVCGILSIYDSFSPVQVILELLFFVGWCRPFSEYFNLWADNVEQCSYMINHYITHFVLNVTSDILILGIPLPLLFSRSRSLGFQCTRRIQAVLVILILMGGFTVSISRSRCAAISDSL
jgi:hypothetical protein